MYVILHMAISLNGIIATPDGKEEFLSDENWNVFVQEAKKIGCIIWGHNTYKQILTWSDKYFNSLDGITKIIVSSQKKITLDPRFELANSPEHALQILENKGFKKVTITGGSTLNAEFAKRNLISEILLTVNPVIVGNGIPLFKPSDFMLELKPIESKVINGLVHLRYKVV